MTAPIAKRPPAQFFKPATDRWTQPFWDAAARHCLVAACCADCGHARMPPTPFCPECQSQSLNWIELPGTGSVYSYTVITRAIMPGMEDCLPYVTAIIALDGGGGTRLISNLVDMPIDRLQVDLPVRVIWDDDWGGLTVPRFILAE
jgi:uncharacterized OB-fold protein